MFDSVISQRISRVSSIKENDVNITQTKKEIVKSNNLRIREEFTSFKIL